MYILQERACDKRSDTAFIQTATVIAHAHREQARSYNVIKKAILADRLFYYLTTFRLGRPLGRGGSLSGGGRSSSGSISSSSPIGDSRSNTMP